MNRISCIICAYNEGPRIKAVLSAVIGHPDIAEVIVVDDGSSDNTAEAALSAGAIVIRHEENQGKSAAVVTGVRAASNETLLFLDADLAGVTVRHITNLLKPVLSGEADIALSHRQNTYFTVSVLWGFDYISGERVIPKSIIEPYLDEISRLPGYGVEVFINWLFIAKRLRIVSVDWMDVKNPNKGEKSSFTQGVIRQWNMVSDILSVTPFHEIVEQHIKLFGQTRKTPLLKIIPFAKDKGL